MPKVSDLYYTRIRQDLLSIIPANMVFNDVLDVGCGVGATGGELKDKRVARRVTGIEINPECAKTAALKLDSVHVADVESPTLSFLPAEFDLIIMADILEHVSNPWDTLRRYRTYLKPGGFLAASIPNVQNWRVVGNLILGNWTYTDWGILDKTHLRFFTRNTMTNLIVGAGFHIQKIHSELGFKAKLLNYLTLGTFRNFAAFKFLILARKDDNDSK